MKIPIKLMKDLVAHMDDYNEDIAEIVKANSIMVKKFNDILELHEKTEKKEREKCQKAKSRQLPKM